MSLAATLVGLSACGLTNSEPPKLEVVVQQDQSRYATLSYPDGRQIRMGIAYDTPVGIQRTRGVPTRIGGIRDLVWKRNACMKQEDFDLAEMVTANIINADEKNPKRRLSAYGGTIPFVSSYSKDFSVPNLKPGMYPVAIHHRCR